MSDTSRTIVPAISKYPDAKVAAKRIVDWLISIGAIKAELSNCILSSRLGFALGGNAESLVYEPKFLPYGLITNGLDITMERTIFHSDLDRFICPKCRKNIVDDDWGNFLDDFINEGESLAMCPACSQVGDLNSYLIEPAWGFSNLGFTFWNWPQFNQSFIDEFEIQLNCRLIVVVTRI